MLSYSACKYIQHAIANNVSSLSENREFPLKFVIIIYVISGGDTHTRTHSHIHSYLPAYIIPINAKAGHVYKFFLYLIVFQVSFFILIYPVIVHT